jgi:hypothetical protein
MKMKNKPLKHRYLIALPTFKDGKGFCHKTILVSARDIADARSLAKHLKPNANIGDIKRFEY